MTMEADDPVIGDQRIFDYSAVHGVPPSVPVGEPEPLPPSPPREGAREPVLTGATREAMILEAESLASNEDTENAGLLVDMAMALKADRQALAQLAAQRDEAGRELTGLRELMPPTMQAYRNALARSTAAGYAAALEEAAKAVCQRCRKGEPLTDGSYHGAVICKAGHIRALVPGDAEAKEGT